MKLLELTVKNLSGVLDGTYSFTRADGAPRDLVILTGDAAGDLLQTIAAVLEALRPPALTLHDAAWWAGRRNAEEARLRARWALSLDEAARAGLPLQTAVSEWRFGPGDRLPRELPVEGALPRWARTDLGRHVFLDANRITLWMEADPLAEVLAGIMRRYIAATRVGCRVGVGIAALSTPHTFATVNHAIAQVFPALRLERVSCRPDEAPVACFRDGQQVELDQLDDAERDAIYMAAELHAADVRGGVVLVDRPQLHVPHAARSGWLDWLAGIAPTNQIIVTQPCDKLVELGADGVPEEHVRECGECRGSRQIVRAIRTMYAHEDPTEGWLEEVLARIDERESRESTQQGRSE